MKKGFTLIELLSVIVILTVILIIAVPKIMNVISEYKKSSFIDSAKLVASNIEKKYQGDLAFGTTFNMGSVDNPVDCSTLISLDSDEYLSCYYYIDSNEKVVVDIIGTDTGKFSGLRVKGNTISMNIVDINEIYHIILDNNGTIDVTYNKDMPTIIIPTKDNYVFVGYYTKENGLGIKYYNSDGTSARKSDLKDTTLYAYFVNKEYTFDYTGNVESLNILTSGTYKLEVWGAQGGDFHENIYNTSSKGGTGGYSTGDIHLNINDTIYIVVGGEGKDSIDTYYGGSGGYNGGGNGGNAGNRAGAAGGGGATHIAISNRGLLENYNSYRDELYIVSAGGGGASFRGTAGSGGGIEGNSSNWVTYNGFSKPSGWMADGGTQTTGYQFGKGGAGRNGSTGISEGADGNGGGGGGFYGGYAVTVSGSASDGSGAGGSGYIGNTSLFNKVMYCYNCTESNDIDTKTISTTCKDSNPISNCAKLGNGYAKITLINAD